MANKYIVTVDAKGTYWRNEAGKDHRLEGPAHEYKNGMVSFWVNGERHREEGPSRYTVDKDGRITGECYFLHNRMMLKAEWEKEVAKLKAPAVDPCLGKVVEVDGKKYRLSAV